MELPHKQDKQDKVLIISFMRVKKAVFVAVRVFSLKRSIVGVITDSTFKGIFEINFISRRDSMQLSLALFN